MSSLISSAELSDDCVSKFSSLVTDLVKNCQSGVLPVKYSDSGVDP